MGYGEYSHAAHVALTRTRDTARPVFASRAVHPLLDPRGVHRECRDSSEHPESLGIAFALDVTGSMGDIPRSLATRTLPDFMQALLDAGLSDPQVCFMAVGHAGHDKAPLQVGQFESTGALIDSWLTRLWLEGGGVGQHEAYELALYFCARKVQLDSVRLRGRRGYLFLTGDVLPNPAVSRVQVRHVLGDQLDADLPIRELITEVQQRFEPFFLVAPGRYRAVGRAWRDLLGDRVVALEDMEDTAYVCASLVALMESAAGSLDEIGRRLSRAGLPRRRIARVVRDLVPLAASLGRDGAPEVPATAMDLPVGNPKSGLSR